MESRTHVKRWLAVLGAIIFAAAAMRYVVLPPRASAGEAVEYRVEIVHNDPYKVQAALNSLTQQGWDYVSSINRTDAKVLLIFRKPNS